MQVVSMEELQESFHVHGLTPVPDSATLTTQQLQREIIALRDIIDVKIDGLKTLIESMLSSTDRAVFTLSQRVDAIPEGIHSAIVRSHELRDERFRSIAVQFAERDFRVEQSSRDDKKAVDAALQAAKEAVTEQNKSNSLSIQKSEGNFTKQIDQIVTMIAAIQKAFDDKIDDVKSRVQMIEGGKRGVSEMTGVIFGVIGVIVGLGGVVIAVVFGLAKQH